MYTSFTQSKQKNIFSLPYLDEHVIHCAKLNKSSQLGCHGNRTVYPCFDEVLQIQHLTFHYILFQKYVMECGNLLNFQSFQLFLQTKINNNQCLIQVETSPSQAGHLKWSQIINKLRYFYPSFLVGLADLKKNHIMIIIYDTIMILDNIMINAIKTI